MKITAAMLYLADAVFRVSLFIVVVFLAGKFVGL